MLRDSEKVRDRGQSVAGEVSARTGNQRQRRKSEYLNDLSFKYSLRYAY